MRKIFALIAILAVSLVGVGCGANEEAGAKGYGGELVVSDSGASGSALGNVDGAARDMGLAEGAAVADIPYNKQRIGSDELGYVLIPADWVEVKAPMNSPKVQYADRFGQCVITMNFFDYSMVDEEKMTGGKTDIVQAGKAIWHLWEKEEVRDISAYKVKINGIAADQISCSYTNERSGDECFSMLWLVEGRGGRLHYVEIDGATPVGTDLMESVENTYSLSL